MIAGEITVFSGNNDNPETQEPTLIECTECGVDPYIEIAVTAGKRRIYLKFRLSDLNREIKELSA